MCSDHKSKDADTFVHFIAVKNIVPPTISGLVYYSTMMFCILICLLNLRSYRTHHLGT